MTNRGLCFQDLVSDLERLGYFGASGLNGLGEQRAFVCCVYSAQENDMGMHARRNDGLRTGNLR